MSIMLSIAKLFPNQYTTIVGQNGILDIAKWKREIKKTKIQEIYNNFTILEENLDLLEYQKFIFDNFGELIADYDTFIIKIKQLYYDDNYEKYQIIKEENITKIVAV
jgi:cell division protein FtsB